jgi:tRNA/rRNA methyltransferase
MSSTHFLSNIRVVLVRTSHPGNIGAAARAMRTMGMSSLYLVEPRHFPHADAVAMAANAGTVIEQATICTSLDEALAGTAMQIAFTARSRALSHAALPVRAAAAAVVDIARAQPAALVFGNETYGLSNEEVLRCNRLAFVATDPEFKSLNLAAAVQVAAYEIWLAALEIVGDPVEPVRITAAAAPGIELASHEEVERFLAHLEQSLYRSGFLQPGNPRRLLERLRRLFARAGLEREEINILRGMLASWDGTAGPHGH